MCRVGAEQRLRGPADRLDAPVAVDLEAGDRRRAGVEHVEQVLVDRDARRQDAVRGERRLQFEPIALDGELRDRAAAGIHGEEPCAVAGQRHRALRAEIGAGAGAACRVGRDVGQRAVGGMRECRHAVAGGRIRDRR